VSELAVVVRHGDSVAELVLNAPERRNALSIAMRDAIADQLGLLADDTDLRALVISANGPVFCAGFDLGEFDTALRDAEFAGRLWSSSDRYHEAVATFPVFTVAAVSGPAIAGGFDLAVLCDLRVAASDAYFEHPEHAFGEVVYGPLEDLVGGGFARDLAFTGRRLVAEDALRIGLVSKVVATDEVRSAALALAHKAATPPRDVIVRMKRKALRRSAARAATGTLDL
jgi:enoyl-CoA hydratase